MNLDKQVKRGEQLASKIDKIAETFDIAESCAEELSEYIEEKLPIETTYEDNPVAVLDDYENSEVIESIIKLDILKEDFQTIRTTLLDTVKNGRLILQSMTDEMLTTDTERKASLITSFAELTNATNQSLKLLSAIYKEIVHVQKEVINFEQPSLDGATINNTQNNFMAMSTADVIKEITGKNK
jgi:hypothetical protein